MLWRDVYQPVFQTRLTLLCESMLNMPTTAPSGKITPQPIMSERRVGIVGGILAAIGPIALSLYTPAMPDIVIAFGTTQAAVKMTLTAYFGGFCLAQLLCGPLSDGYGRRPVTIGFMTIYLLASVLALIAPTIDTLIVARFFQGVGAAVGITVSRAIVRDLFTSDASSRVMNLIGIVLSVGPAIAPTLGGLTLSFFSWHEIFLLMVLQGVAVILIVIFFVRETGSPDPKQASPAILVRSYFSLIKERHFLLASLVLSGATGALYTSATLLPFILMERVGLSATSFGIGMLLQTSFYLSGGLLYRLLMSRLSPTQLTVFGLFCLGLASLLLIFLLSQYDPTYLSVMLPMGLYVMGIAFLTPQMSTAALAPFPHIAGSASALMGFFQIAGGFAGGLVASAMPDPVFAMALILPVMGGLSLVGFIFWYKLRITTTINAVLEKDEK